MEIKKYFLFVCMSLSARQHLAGLWCDFTLLRSLLFLPICILLNRFWFYLTPVSLVFSSQLSSPASTYPCKLSVRRHFCDYITFSRGTTTQAFEMLGFFRALAAFISQELVLTVWDTHWSWRPLKRMLWKRLEGQESQFSSPLHGSQHSIDAIDSFSFLQPRHDVFGAVFPWNCIVYCYSIAWPKICH